MIIYKHAKDLQEHLQKLKQNERSIGFVPTMGALHNGHLSLIKQSKLNTDITVSSIYVNPVQFNNQDDFKKYPVTLESDILLLEDFCDILFLPEEEDIYPDENSKHKHFEIGDLEKRLEGKYRPGHFQGVCMVVERLLNIIEPTHLFLGQKDYQQSLIIKKLTRLLNKNIAIIISPTVREPNGLAMSSRNLRLNAEEKNRAADLYKSLVEMNAKLQLGNNGVLKNEIRYKLEKKGFKIDYLEIAAAGDLELIDDVKKSAGLIILAAAYLSNVRLIDNLIVTA